MPKRNRLSRDEISRTTSRGRRFHGTYALCIVTPAEKPLFAVVVSKTVLKLASGRAKAKRRYRELLRDVSIPAHIVLVAKKGAAAVPFAELKADLEKLLKSIGDAAH